MRRLEGVHQAFQPTPRLETSDMNRHAVLFLETETPSRILAFLVQGRMKTGRVGHALLHEDPRRAHAEGFGKHGLMSLGTCHRRLGLSPQPRLTQAPLQATFGVNMADNGHG